MEHWLPFKESEIGVKQCFDRDFMTKYMSGTLQTERHLAPTHPLQHAVSCPTEALKFSETAALLFNAALSLWRFYHNSVERGAYTNASLFDIREYFQARNDKGRMNSKSANSKYNELIGDFRGAQKLLAKKIEPKVYEYGFLKA